MEIIVAKNAGFCGGVERTIKLAEELLSQGSIYCLGEIVHNEQVIYELEKKEMKTVNSIDEVPDRGKVIFRAHGEAKEVYETAKRKNIDVIDLTCGKVRAIHINVEREKENSFIIIIGKKSHPEIIGTKGFAGDNSSVIENEEDIKISYEEYKKTNLKKVYIVAQTTFSSLKFNGLVEKIKEVFDNAEIIVKNTICDATENRQKEVEEISKKVDKMLIIGGKHSSNTKELANIAEKNCKNVYLIQDKDDLKSLKFNDYDTIGIMSGASTPREVVEEIKKGI